MPDTRILISEPVPGSEGSYRLKFPGSFQSRKDDKIALVSLTMYYSFYNITDLFENRTLIYSHGGRDFTIKFDEGYYEISDINNYIKMKMREEGNVLLDDKGSYQYYIDVKLNINYYANTLTMKPVPSVLPAGWTNPHNMALTGLTMMLKPQNKFGDLIGFESENYPPLPQDKVYMKNSVKKPVISPVQNILIKTDWISDNRFHQNGDNLHNFTPSESFGSQISINPPEISYIRILAGLKKEIVVRFVDQLNRPLILKDKEMLITLSLREPDDKEID